MQNVSICTCTCFCYIYQVDSSVMHCMFLYSTCTSVITLISVFLNLYLFPKRETELLIIIFTEISVHSHSDVPLCKKMKCIRCGSIFSLVQILFSFVLGGMVMLIMSFKQRKIKFAPRTKLHHNITPAPFQKRAPVGTRGRSKFGPLGTPYF